jgi:hypothetical protein
MFHENLVMRNLNVLVRLTQGEATLEELAKTTKCRVGDLGSSIRILQDQGLIQHSEGKYRLMDRDRTQQVLQTINPWISYFNGAFHDIAKDVAKIIFEKGYEDRRVVDVMLYGSALTSPSPSDIDLLIIHNHGAKMKCFSPYETLRVDEPVGENNARDSAFGILRKLGYKYEGKGNDSVVAAVGERIAGLGMGRYTAGEIDGESREWERTSREVFEYTDKPNVATNIDLYGIEGLFDINVLDALFLQRTVPNAREDSAVHSMVPSMREEAIKSCRDQTFWHTILTEGRLYDRAKHDFTIRVNDKYPGATDLFPSK